jgi:phosphoglycerate dehydrogenase-like enzyme
MASLQILNRFPLPDDAVAALRAIPGVSLVSPAGDTPSDEELAAADVLLGEVPDGNLDRAPRLRWMVRAGAGVEDLDLGRLAARGVIVTNASGLHAASMGEYCLGALLFAFQHHATRLNAQRRGVWDAEGAFASPLRGRTLAVLGYGSIGREVARLGHAFGMRVLAVKQRPEQRRDDGFVVPGTGDPEGRIPERIVGLDHLDDVLAEADAVVIALPLTDRTRGLFDDRRLRRMKPTAWIVNVGRGPMIDETALVAALVGGRLGGAYLDVFDEEPLPDGHPYWTTPNLYLSPHIAGVNSYERYWTDMGALLEINVPRFLKGEPLLNTIDPTRAY